MPAPQGQSLGHRELDRFAKERTDECSSFEQRKLTEVTISDNLERQFRQPFTPGRSPGIKTKQACTNTLGQIFGGDLRLTSQPPGQLWNEAYPLRLGPFFSFSNLKLHEIICAWRLFARP